MSGEVGKGAASGALSSAATGAATGAAIGSVVPGIGTAVGAAVGAVVGAVYGGIAGGFSGGKAKKAKKYAKMAAAVKREREENAVYDQYLQYIRNVRVARSEALLGAVASNAVGSSASQGGLAGIGSQAAYTIQYTAEDKRLNDLYNTYMRLANKNAKKAEDIMDIKEGVDMGVAAVGAVVNIGSLASTQQAAGGNELFKQATKNYASQLSQTLPQSGTLTIGPIG